ncbi:serine/threonine-protein kinase Nek8 isoform X2 [Dromiciops gliroides]|nr:serine/threonine-protein kinase Nek8 isoform X2 [Dromiciops gliroides]
MTKDERLAAQNECQVLKLLSHPNVIEYYENFLEDKALMIAMEYAPGGTLAEFIQKRCNSLLDEETILHFFVQILLALHHVHTHLILHRDLKTQNILLDKHQMIVKIGDFGISKILSSKSKAYTVVGTPCYISPELCEGKPYNQKSDIWALGCVLYELASLKRAFEAAVRPGGQEERLSCSLSHSLWWLQQLVQYPGFLFSDRLSLNVSTPSLVPLLLPIHVQGFSSSTRPPLIDPTWFLSCWKVSFSLAAAGFVPVFSSLLGLVSVSCLPHQHGNFPGGRACVCAGTGFSLSLSLSWPGLALCAVHVVFECLGFAQNLPALVLKIMSGTFAPISDRYSVELRQLVLSLLSLEPSQRPPLSHIMAQPLCVRALLNLYTDVGSVRMKRVEKPLGSVPSMPCGRAGGRTSGPRSRGGPQGLPRPAIPPPLSSVYTWGGGLSIPTRLPMLNTEVVQVSAGRTQKAGVTRSGRLIMWEAPPMGVGGGILLPGALEQHQPQFISRFLEGQSGVTIKHVACGDLFTACLTDRGIIMTFGSGSNGCLGHGSFTDLSQPTIVEALLGYEMVQVACGASHVLALSTERELFAWGRGDGGRLGLGTRESHSSPQQVPMPPEQEAQWVVCGIDSSMILTVPGRALACGSNRFNKLGLDRVSPGEDPASHDQVEEALSFMPLGSVPLDSEPLVSVDVGTAHSAAVTASGVCYTFGSNQHGQLGTSAHRGSRAPCLVAGLQGIKVVMVACGDAFTVAIGAEGDVYTWGKGARGRLGRKDEDAGLPRPVQLDEAQPYLVTSVSCCHGNTLLAIRPATEESVPP